MSPEALCSSKSSSVGTATSQRLGYRAEIDGLRALAVLGVVFFHAGVRNLSGGYAGVDVFFVISGFLITQFIDARIAAGRFSVGEFYERRIRRILPALACVCLFTWIAAYELLLPLDFHSYGASLLATVSFLSNVFFWHKSGYFAAPAATEPLLHTWSLAVEEQFYIVFPLFMLLISRLGRRATKLIIAITWVLSFGFSAAAVRYAPSFAFYLPFSRAWELLLGSALALQSFPALNSQPARTAASATGLLLIGASFLLYTTSTAFPGAAALAPCLGTALILFAEGPALTPVGRMLGLKPLTAIGLISYSLYLWHWPLIVFARYAIERPLQPLGTLVIIAISIGAAALSWKFIEQPLRGKGAIFSRKQLFASSAGAGAILALAGLIAYLGHGLPQRISHQALRYDQGALDFGPDRSRCLPSRVSKPRYCTIGVPGQPSFIVWGDSHAAALLPAFKALASKERLSGELAAQSACAPLLGVHRSNDPQGKCAQFNATVLARIEREDIHTVFLVSRWSINAQGASPYELTNGMPQAFIEDASTRTLSLAENSRVFVRGLLRTLTALRGRRVIILLQAPDPDVLVPTYLARAANAGVVGGTVRIRFDTFQTYQAVRLLMEPLAHKYGVTVLDPSKVLCHGWRCLIALHGHSLYIDDQHLSVHGSQLLEPLIASQLPPPSAVSATPSAEDPSHARQ